MQKLRTVCVFCGSSNGNRPEYLQVAEQVGAELARRGIGLVYGGGALGLMGAVARTVHENGGQVTGVLPRPMMVPQVLDGSVGELIPVDSLAERKQVMFDRSDAFLTLPGGYGTLDELFEAVTYGQLWVHAKPVGLLNVQGYFDPLLQWIEQSIEQGFVRSMHRGLIIAHTDPAALLDQLSAYEAPHALLQWKKQ